MSDIEKNGMSTGYRAGGSPAGSEYPPAYGEHEVLERKWHQRFVDSFKRDPNAHSPGPSVAGTDSRMFDAGMVAIGTATSPLHRRLKGRHLQMIAIGGSIGKASGRWR